MNEQSDARTKQEQYLQCWDCESEEVRLFTRGNRLMAECADCKGILPAHQLYHPEPNNPEEYDMEMDNA